MGENEGISGRRRYESGSEPGVDERTLEGLVQLGTLLASTLSPREVAAQVAEYGCVISGLGAFLVYLIAEEGGRLEAAGVEGLAGDLSAAPLRLLDIAAIDLERTAPAVVPLDSLGSQSLTALCSAAGHQRAWLAPLVIEGVRQAGLMIGLDRRSAPPHPQELRLFRLLALQAMGALSNSVRREAGRQAEEALRESELRLRLATQAAGMYTWELDVATREVKFSGDVEQVLGFTYTEGDDVFSRIARYVDPEDGARHAEALRRTMRGEGDLHSIIRVRNPETDGTVWMETYATPLRSDDGSTQRVIGIARNVTDRQQAAEALRESEERYRLLFENMNEGFALCEMIWDDAGAPVDWRYLEVNEAWAQTGVPVAGTVGRTAREINPEVEPYWIETYGRVVQTGEPVTLEAYASGFGKWFQTFAFKHTENHFAVLFLDVTERTLAEEALLAQKLEKAAEGERNRLARDLHDSVTQALFAANLKAEALTFLPDLDPRATNLTTDMHRLSRGALAQMRTLLLELRGDPVEDIPIGQLFEHLVEATKGRTAAAITYDVEGQAELPAAVHVAVYRITQEALNNMAKHAGASEAKVHLLLQDHTARLVIRDDGRGFDSCELSQEHMGLRSMTERASEIGALLTVDSIVGRGTTVTLEWPAEPAA